MMSQTNWLLKTGLLALIAIVLLIDAAALHDIWLGESSVWMEWTFILISVAVLFFAFRALRRLRSPERRLGI